MVNKDKNIGARGEYRRWGRWEDKEPGMEMT
jgi:hypothetical protein